MHEISEIVGGMVILPATPEVITGFIEAAEAAPEELSTIANVMLAPPMPSFPRRRTASRCCLGCWPMSAQLIRPSACWGPSGARQAVRRHGAADALPGDVRR